jgi:hypothetical protein
MNALEEHPMAVKTNLAMDIIIVEVMRIINPKIEGKIHDLELHASY